MFACVVWGVLCLCIRHATHMHFIFYLQVDIGGGAVQIEVLKEPLIIITVCLMLILCSTLLANYWCGVVCPAVEGCGRYTVPNPVSLSLYTVV